MLRLMRENNNFRIAIIVFVCVALAAFVFYGFGTAPVGVPGDTVANVGSAKIRVRDINMSRDRVGQMFNNSQLPPESVRSFIASQTIRNAVLLDGANKSDLVVSRDELRDVVIQQRTREDGSYLDSEQWADGVQYVYNMQVGAYEEYLQEELLRTSKFANLLYAGVYVPESEIRESYVEQNTRVRLEMVSVNALAVKDEIDLAGEGQLKIFYEENPEIFVSGDLRQAEFVAFRPADYLDQVEVSDEDLRAHYDANIARFTRSEQVGASHILVKVDDKTEEEALAKLAEIKAAIDGGTDFAEVAKQFSEGPSAPQGGNLGTFGKGRMVPAFEQAVWPMEVGTVSEPVKTQFGYHVIKKDAHIEGRTESFDEVKTLLTGELRQSKAMDYLMGLGGQLKAKAQELNDFQAAAADMSLTVETSPFFDSHNNSYLGETLDSKFQVRTAIFAMEELNQVSDPINARDMVVVAKWTAEKQPEVLPFENNQVRIRGLAEQAAGKLFLEDFIAELKAKAEAAPEKPLKDFQGDYAWAKQDFFTESALITADSLPFGIDKTAVDFQEDIFSKETGAFLDLPTDQENRVILVRLKEKQEADMEKFAEERINTVNNLRRQAGLNLETSYLFGLMQRYDGNDQVTNRVLAALDPANRR